MINKFTILLFLYTGFLSSPTLVADCETNRIIQRGEIICVDTLSFTCSRMLPMFDNSIITIYNVVGVGEIIRADSGGGVRIDSLGIDRRLGDANPMVILIGCESDFTGLEIGNNIDITEIFDNCEN